MTSSQDEAYCYMRYGYRPLQDQVNCQDNPLDNDNGYYPSTFTAITQQTFNSVSHRTELAILADLYRYASLKRVTWTVRPKRLIQERVSQIAGTMTSAAWTATARDVLIRQLKPCMYYAIMHVEKNPRNTDNGDTRIAGGQAINVTGGIGATTDLVIPWPDEGYDTYVSSTPGGANQGSQNYNYFDNIRKIRKTSSMRGFKGTWKPLGRSFTSHFREKNLLNRIELRSVQALENGTNDDTVLGTGVEDDFCAGGLWFALPIIGMCGEYGVGDPAATNAAVSEWLIGCNATYSFFGRY